MADKNQEIEGSYPPTQVLKQEKMADKITNIEKYIRRSCPGLPKNGGKN